MANGKPAPKTPVKAVETEIQEAISNEKVPNLYANSFSFLLGTGDIVILFKNSFKPIATLNLSYTGAKSLAIKLNEMITYLESKTGNKIMSTDEIGEVFKVKK